MFTAYGIVIPIFLAAIGLFFWLSPKDAPRKKLAIFNGASIATAIMFSCGYVLYLQNAMANGSDYGWWPVLSFLSSMAITSMVLLVFGLARNLVVFRKKDENA